MKSIFLGDWMYKCMSYYNYWQKPPLKGALKTKWMEFLESSNTINNDLKSN